MTAVVTHGDFSAAWQVGIFIGIVCGLIASCTGASGRSGASYLALAYAGSASPPDSSTVSAVPQ